MSFLKRAILYLARKKGRTALLAGMVVVMSCFVLVGISLKNSADREAKKLRQSLATGFTLKADEANDTYYETRDGAGHSYRLYVGPRVTEELISQIMSVEGVTDYQVHLLSLAWTDLNLMPGQWATSEENEPVTAKQIELNRQSILIYPCRKGELDSNFRTGAFSITEGRNIQEGDHYTAVISEWLAEENGLDVGDVFIIEAKDGFLWGSQDILKTLGEPIPLAIVGLFRPNFQPAYTDMTFEDGHVENLIYSDMDTYHTLEENFGEDESDKSGYMEATFFVEDPMNLDSIMQQIQDRDDIDIDGLLFEADDTAYKASVKPLSLISLFSTIILATGIIGIGAILYLVLNLWIKSRVQEAGIFLSVGIRKKEILCQMLAECLIVGTTALLLSLFLSGPVIDTCAQTAEQLAAPKSTAEPYSVREDYSKGPIITKISSEEVTLEHTVSFRALVLMVVIVYGISSVSVLLASIQLLDLEPKQLLTMQ